jgi:hypothetical protein
VVRSFGLDKNILAPILATLSSATVHIQNILSKFKLAPQQSLFQSHAFFILAEFKNSEDVKQITTA